MVGRPRDVEEFRRKFGPLVQKALVERPEWQSEAKIGLALGGRMNSQEERRVDGIQRVPVEALVEVCGLKSDVPSFEAESRNVSDRGIRLRTAYLPELGAPVVCRFENGGQEVLAEGVIAWRSAQPRGGEFGVRFTALNSKSAQVLGKLCRGEPDSHASSGGANLSEDTPEQGLRAGTKVKLHIAGLSSPMRARVQQGDSDQICVNSSLEFLRLGKRLHLENVEAGDQSEAYIDGIDVVIDPETGVPNLVVVLRTNEAENTPEPSVIDTASDNELLQGGRTQSAAAAAETDDSDPDESEGVADEVAAMRGKLEQSLSKVGLMIRITGTQAASIGKTLRDRGGPLVQRLARYTWAGGRRGKPEVSPPRRRTAPPPSQVSGAMSHGLRPQARSVADPEVAPLPKPKQHRKMIVTTLGVGALLVTVIAVASRGGAPTVASNSSNPQARAAANATTQTLPAASQGVTPAAAPGASAIMAPVPLFGITPMATLEPAPLGSAPPPAGAPPNAIAEREMAAARAATAQVATGTEEASEEPESGSSSEEPAAKPEDVAPWGKGKMHDPVIFRVKLDGPANAIKGKSLTRGFSVIIPKRKAEESPKGYAKQDSRIEKVSAANADNGVKILWLFKDEIPGYRVRLRKNSVEFLISSKTK